MYRLKWLGLIPDPLCWKWRWNVQPEKSVCHKTMDLGSVNAQLWRLTSIEYRVKTGHLAWPGGSGNRSKDGAPSLKLQATSLTAGPGDDRMNLERNNNGHNTIEKNSRRSGRDPETSKAGYAKVWKKETLSTITCCHGLLMIMAHCRPVTWPAVRSSLKELRRHLQRHIRIFSGPQFHSDKRQAASDKLQATSLTINKSRIL